MGRTGRGGKWLFCLVPILVVLVWTMLLAQQQAPLSKGDVVGLLAAGVPSARLAVLVEERGIGFEMTPETADELRRAGASDELVVTLKFATKLRRERDPEPSVTFLVESEPGSADIYLNDEPKGTTSPEGNLRLAGLAPGTHRLRICAKGFQTWEKAITAKTGEVRMVTVVLSKVSSVSQGGGQSETVKVVPTAVPAKPKLALNRSAREILVTSKTLCLVLDAQTQPVIRSEISKRLHKWGGLTLVASPESADLVLRITQTGQLGRGVEGHQAVASLVERETAVELWSSTQGGSWTLSGWNPGWVGRSIADDFIKFYNSTVNARGKSH